MTSPELVDVVLGKVAGNVAARYRGVAEYEDIKQELWLWWLSHEQPDLADPDWATMRNLFTAAERYCRKERSARQGPGETYTKDEVFALVELIVNPPTDQESDRLGGELAEVMTAVTNLPTPQRAALAAHAAGETYRDIAEKTGLSVASAYRRVQQALTTIVDVLNGAA